MGSGYICYYDSERRRPCPKCGSWNYAYGSDHRDYKKNRALDAHIICLDCGHRTRLRRTVEEAVEEWNGG